MKHRPGKAAKLALLATAVGLAAANPKPAHAQATPASPAWMQDSGFFYPFNPYSDNFQDPFTTNRYLALWEYFRGSDIGSFNVWNNEGNPQTSSDNFQYLFRYDNMGKPTAYVVPWNGGGISISGERPGRGLANTRPRGTFVTIRVDNPAQTGGSNTTPYTDLVYPDDGTARVSFAYPNGLVGPIGIFPNGQGTYAPYRFTGGTGSATYDLQIDQRVSFARDLVRIEYNVHNSGGNTRQVGVRLLLDPYADEYGSSAFFIPKTREQIKFEKDFGRAVGTTVAPQSPTMPAEWQLFDSSFTSGGTPFVVSKCIVTGNGATTPDRLVFGNGLQMFAQALGGQTWDYTIDTSQDLRQSDLCTLMYWNPITVPPGQTKTFVTYAGLGFADHGMSDFYRATPPAPTNSYGFVGAVQSPFAIPVSYGADVDTQTTLINAYLQNELNDYTPNGFALLNLPDGLELESDPSSTPQSAQADLGTLDPLASAADEASVIWRVKANGVDAGLLPVVVQYATGYGDTASVTRTINVPQGRLYQFGDDWRMVTFPFNYDANASDPTEVFGLDAGDFQIVQYNPIINDYELVSNIQPGQGYWVRMRGLGTQSIQANGAQALDLQRTGPRRVSLKRGWNMVGNPSPYAVPVRDLQILAPPVFLSFQDAVNRSYIRPTLYQWNRKTQVYDRLTQDSVLSPGKGVWIYSTSERVMLWPAPTGPEISVQSTIN